MVVGSVGGLVPVFLVPAACAKDKPSFVGTIIFVTLLGSLLQLVTQC